MTSDNRWVVYSLLAMTSYAINNFLLSAVGEEAENAADANVSSIFVVWAVAGVSGLIALLVLGPRTVVAGMSGLRNIALLVVAGLLNATAMLCLSLALAADPLSAGPITAMLPLNSLFVAGMTFVFLGEKLSRRDGLGISIAVLGPVCMAAADMSGNALRGLAFGVATAAFFACSNFLRKLAVARQAQNTSVVVFLFLVIGVCSVIAIGACTFTGRGFSGLSEPRLAVFAVASGTLWVIGSGFFQLALKGLAGPASAIANTNSVGVLLLQVVFFHPSMKVLKLLGMCLCIIGVTILSVKPRPKVAAAAPEQTLSFQPINPTPLTGLSSK